MVVRCPEEVPREEVIKSITPWLEAANFTMGQEVVVAGDPVAKQFTLEFQGPMLATRESRRKQAHTCLRLATGKWRDFFVDLPAKRVPLYVGNDKNRKEIATEIALKKLRNTLQKEAGLTTFMDRDGGRLLARWEPLAKVAPHPGTR
eukprot:1518821-Pyramimonas_sp.AAC.1